MRLISRPLLSALAAAAAAAAPPSASDLASSTIARYMALPPSGPSGLKMSNLPDYGPSICLSAMYEAAERFGRPAYATWVGSLLDAYLAEPPSSSNAAAVLANFTVPWGYSVGDDMGLFPIAYLSRATYSHAPFGVGVDWELALRVADEYVLGWPLRLPDGTMSRHAGWTGEPDVNASFLWDDDQFMGLALLARIARHPDCPAERARRHVDAIAAQQLAFAGYLQDASTGLYKHGFNHATGHRSCCSWGRANGWLMMSHAEAVAAVAAVDRAHPSLPAMLDVWRRHAAGLAARQAPGDGRFHQVLDDETTFLETSVTSMTIFSLIEGVLGGWLEEAAYASVIDAAWAGLAKAVDADGTVNGICTGTGIGTDVAFCACSAVKALSKFSRPVSRVFMPNPAPPPLPPSNRRGAPDGVQRQRAGSRLRFPRRRGVRRVAATCSLAQQEGAPRLT